MKNVFFSLSPTHPDGFEYKEPTRRDLLTGDIVLYTESLERAFSLLDNFCQRVHGLIVTEGETFQQTALGPQLLHLQIIKGALTPFDLISTCFNLTQSHQTELEENNRLKIELARIQRDQREAKEAYNDYAKYLGQKMAQMRDEIEKRRVAEAQLSILKIFSETSSQGMGWSETNGTIAYVNHALADLLGEPDQQTIIGKPIGSTYYSDAERMRLNEEILPSVIKGTPWSGELTLTNKQGESILTHNNLFLIKDKKTKHTYIGNIISDIREEKKLEAELSKIKKLESVGVLAGGIAHDFNNLLAAILGNIDLSLTEVNPESEVYQLLEQAQKASLRAKNLTQQLLTFSKGGTPIKQTASIGKIITDSADFVLHGTSTACRYTISDDLWAVDIDVGQMGQVIQNLVINASQAMPSGGMIEIICKNSSGAPPEKQEEEKQITITIADQGCGISSEQMERIFDPYFSTKKQGSGLGLAICHSIIIKHGGRISVQSEKGKGTTFSITLPASTQATKTELATATPNQTSKTKQQLRCLVMDDEPMIRIIAERMLARLGHETALAEDGDEAIKLYQEAFDHGTPFDLCIMDLTIPGGMGGEQAVQEILKIDPHATAIVSSGYSNDPIVANYSEHGFKAALSKPFMVVDLKNTLSAFMDEPDKL